MSQVRKLAGETFIYGMGSILPKVLNFLLLAPYLTRVLDKENFGIHGILYAYVALFISVFTLRLETAYFRFATRSNHPEKAYGSALTAIILVGSILALVIFSNAQLIASWLTSAEDARYVKWFAMILLFDAISALPFAKLRLENKALKFSAIKIVNVLVTAVIILFYLTIIPGFNNPDSFFGFPFYYSLGKDLDYVFLANLIASAIVLIMLIPELIQAKLTIDRTLLKKMLIYSSPLILVGVAGAINQVFDRVFVSKLLASSDAIETAGAYNGAAKVAVIMSLFATAFNYAAEPFFFKSFKDEDSTDIYAYVLKAFTITGLLVFMVITLFLDQAMYLIGAEYRVVRDIVPILLFAYLFLGIYYNVSIWYKLKDKTYMGAMISFSGALVTIIANIILIPRIGYVGAAWSALICYITMVTFAYFSGKKHLPIPYDLRGLSIYLLMAVVMVGLSLYFKINFILKIIMILLFMGYAIWKDRGLLKI
ncbi:lipopolysaccharide biosynthesis protein [Portibacter marinus]|uniref:lipopolysaccharide biosynthesis protein n=1 Tax=Portibacter marinus TaxID=2898660 RepID=UPI001F27B014|nr:oligosaccharide flippase family protein [Portibacter marinus]